MFSLNSKSTEPIYIQLEKAIVKYIHLGVYEKDSLLPSVRSLATELGINPNTVSKAYKNLEANGVIYTISGKGVFVNGTQSLSGVKKLAEKNIKLHLKDAKNAGLKRSEIMKIINIVWEENESD